MAKKFSVPTAIMAKTLVIQGIAGYDEKYNNLEILLLEIKELLLVGNKVGAGALVASAMIEANALSQEQKESKAEFDKRYTGVVKSHVQSALGSVTSFRKAVSDGKFD